MILISLFAFLGCFVSIDDRADRDAPRSPVTYVTTASHDPAILHSAAGSHRGYCSVVPVLINSAGNLAADHFRRDVSFAALTFQIIDYQCSTGVLQYKLTGGDGSSIYLNLSGIFAGTVTADVVATHTFPSDGRIGRTVTGTATQSGNQINISFTNGCNLNGTNPTPPPPNPPTPPNPTPTTISLNPYSGDAYFVNGVVGIGTTNVGDRSALLSVKGKIRAQEIRVENGN